ncbi:deoxyribodipyrimidine photo-lyase [Streptomyces sp. HUCO-GS316]|uniref:FAD-binding domain-containing protein n=1 Tax=Streptomyces sp. HUCO-GS316 TaxID=2692198 RepID=UPI001371133C|nr:deoxyribodipyrimidine photo-lyase [Streptomyces sp. HUCO-GS316]
MGVSVALFTADLRVHDNPVLRAALRDAERVVPLFVVDNGIRRTGFVVPNRAAFLADSLADLDAALRACGGWLVVRAGDVVEETCRVAVETGASVVHIAGGVSRYAARREDRLRAELAQGGRPLRVHDASLTAVPPGALIPAGKDHFAVFTPYFRRWEGFSVRDVLPAPDAVPVPEVGSAGLPDVKTLLSCPPGPVSPGLPAGGETEGRRRLRSWLAGPLDRYEEQHDDLTADATSRLSPYLHFGCLSPAEALHRARAHAGPGAHAFVRQLAWRDFNHQVLAARPDAAHHDYRPRHDRWRADAEQIRAWKEGRTGYPVVDAAMRQLRHEGWMPGRARMLAASFLAKTLYVDWRVGARHFLDLLVDGDIANNQLNWQWVAGTGTDTRPNRVLNPLVQARRFDPRGAYAHRWLPELRTTDAMHLPDAVRREAGYPTPIVDLAEATARFKRLRG